MPPKDNKKAPVVTAAIARPASTWRPLSAPATTSTRADYAAVLAELGLVLGADGRCTQPGTHVLPLAVSRKCSSSSSVDTDERPEAETEMPTMPELNLDLGALADGAFSVTVAFYVKYIMDRGFHPVAGRTDGMALQPIGGLDVAHATIVCSPRGVVLEQEARLLGGLGRRVKYCDALEPGKAYLIARTVVDHVPPIDHNRMRFEASQLASDSEKARGIRELWFADLIAGGDSPIGNFERAFYALAAQSRPKRSVHKIEDEAKAPTTPKKQKRRSLGALIDTAARAWIPHFVREVDDNITSNLGEALLPPNPEYDRESEIIEEIKAFPL